MRSDGDDGFFFFLFWVRMDCGQLFYADVEVVIFFAYFFDCTRRRCAKMQARTVCTWLRFGHAAHCRFAGDLCLTGSYDSAIIISNWATNRWQHAERTLPHNEQQTFLKTARRAVEGL